ncbi:MAG: helix-turn-helix domain-containing protein [Acidimicrobiales bacterium]
MVGPLPTYREWSAEERLSGSVACLWVALQGEDQASRDPVLPDACIDLLWDGVSLLVAGPDTGPAPIVWSESGYFAGLRFRPGRAPSILGVPASEIVDQRVELEALWGTNPVGRLAADLATAPDPDAAAEMLGRAVAERASAASSADAAVDGLATLLLDRRIGPGDAAVRAASEALSIGERRLHRLCLAAVGYGPKTLERILRFQRARQLVARGSGTFAAVAAEAGYADQSHFVRECHRLAGTTPSDLFKTAGAIAP